MDSRLYRHVNRFADRTRWLHGAMSAYAKYGVALFGVLLLAVWLRGRAAGALRLEAGAVWAGAAALVALGVGQVIGHAVGRQRPYAVLSGVHVLVPRTTDVSFPSDHALAVGAVAIGLLVVDRAVGLVAVGLALLMALARVYVGAHYPGDVAAGLLIGGGIAAAGAVVVIPAVERVLRRLLVVPGVPLLVGARSGDEEALAGRPRS